LQKKKNLDPSGLVTAFNKLAQLDGGKSSMLSSHPASPARSTYSAADRIESVRVDFLMYVLLDFAGARFSVVGSSKCPLCEDIFLRRGH
jgi:hypothetical protein